MRFRIVKIDDEQVDIRWRPVALDWIAWARSKITVSWWIVAGALLFGVFVGRGCDCTMPPLPPWPGPGPKPPPVPPQPVGFTKAVLVYQVQTDTKTPAVWHDPQVQEYVRGKCQDNVRALDPDIDVSKGPEWVKSAMTAFKTSGIPPPALLVLRGDRWAVSPWPDKSTDAVALLKKLGG